MTTAQEVELLGITEFRSYFPGSEILIERFAGLPKSLVAVRGHGFAYVEPPR